MLTLANYFLRIGSSTSSLSATLWAKDQSLFSILQRCFQLSSESKEWLGPFASTTLLVSISDSNLSISYSHIS